VEFRRDCASYALLANFDARDRELVLEGEWAAVGAGEAGWILRDVLARQSAYRSQLIDFWMRYERRPERGRFDEVMIVERLVQGLDGGGAARLRLLRRWDLLRAADFTGRELALPDELEPPPELHFIEVELIDQDGEPHRGVPIELTDTESRLRALSTRGHGVAYVGSLQPGSCKIVVSGGEDEEPLEPANLLSISLAFNDGSPAAGAAYVAGDARGTLDAGGRALLTVRGSGPGQVSFPGLPTATVELLDGVAVSPGAANRLVAMRAPLCHRITGYLFDIDKAFMLPTGVEAMQQVRRAYAEYTQYEVVVVGHTDTTGARSHNQALSAERADAVASYLRDDVDAWLAWYGSGKPAKKRWGAREDALMAAELHRREQGDGPSPESPVAWFQRAKGLQATGTADESTRRALITGYMAADETTLPAGTTLRTRGEGEDKPLVDTGDGVEEQLNRRVEILFCEPGKPEPEIPRTKPKPKPKKKTEPPPGEPAAPEPSPQEPEVRQVPVPEPAEKPDPFWNGVWVSVVWGAQADLGFGGAHTAYGAALRLSDLLEHGEIRDITGISIHGWRVGLGVGVSSGATTVIFINHDTVESLNKFIDDGFDWDIALGAKVPKGASKYIMTIFNVLNSLKGVKKFTKTGKKGEVLKTAVESLIKSLKDGIPEDGKPAQFSLPVPFTGPGLHVWMGLKASQVETFATKTFGEPE